MLDIFKLSLKGAKRLFATALVLGVIATYTAYKGESKVKSVAAQSLQEVLADMEVQGATPAGQEIIVAYNAAIEAPTAESFERLHRLIRAEAESGSQTVRFPGNSTFDNPEVQTMFAYNANQLSYVESPIASGAGIFLLCLLITYPLVVAFKALGKAFVWGFRRISSENA
ncbi:hypothetical protein [Marinobacter salsuginis]|uniref:Uncharacterized protein n=1 Tax=Marinobacter salsuginis TaxID=418719 RepID=A0A5M3Q0D8_9GAMM|nr:hypothetical protein [Marinobacter salsuginis]GBO88664.1 hypothetical protein MSSD14B_23320 [Marinobacter salsuginis]